MSEAEKRAAEWLKKGARMLSESCPHCSSPLFDWKGEIWCPSCGKPVITTEERKLVAEIEEESVLQRIRETIISRLYLLEKELKSERDLRRLQEASSALYLLLSCLEIMERIKSSKEN